MSRREFLKSLALLLAALALPLRWAGRTQAAWRGRFFTGDEFSTLEALCDRIIPPDHDPGARALQAPVYISRMLSAFDRRPPLIFGRGPFSRRNPFPDNDNGTASHRLPRNSFRRSIRLTRVQELFWRAQLFGSVAAGVPAHLDTQRGGALAGLRDIYRDGLQAVEDSSLATKGRRFVDLTPTEQDEIITMLDVPGGLPPISGREGRFLDLVIRHTIEGCFSSPEYGGNFGGEGWAMIGLEGDSQPLGYSIYSRATDSYNERADHPMSTPNPDELAPDGALVPRPLSADGRFIQGSIVLLTSILPEGCG